jgi:FGFR1 oncogene partner
MDELKNLVIQTLETNGILGQIRAKLRSSVFKVIDNNDPSHKEKAMHWENPLAQKVLETTESALAADLIREYLEFYRLDYTLSIMIPEANLKQEPLERDDLVRRAEVDSANEKEPLLIQILKERKSGGRPKPNIEAKKDKPQEQPKSQPQSQPQPKSTFVTSSSPPAPKVEKINKFSSNNKDDLDYLKKPVEKPKETYKDNTYEDDFGDDDIEESLPDNDMDHDDDNNFGESGNAFTGSQSMGMDPSVNTLAMDEYDHVEEVVRYD